MVKVKRSILEAVLGHGLVLLLLIIANARTSTHPLASSAPKELKWYVQWKDSEELAGRPLNRGNRAKLLKGQKAAAIDLRPSFSQVNYLLKPQAGTAAPSGGSASQELGLNQAQATQLMNISPQVLISFDHLAQQIGFFLDYPELLAQNGVQGVATLDLYFNDSGDVDEDRSMFLGGRRSLRGVLVRATRQGLQKWYASDGSRLNKSQFRNQHFRADFSLSYVLENENSVSRVGEGKYQITRRRYLSVCANPVGLDIACLAVKSYGAVKNLVNNDSKLKFRALEDRLSDFDQMGLRGINQEIHGT